MTTLRDPERWAAVQRAFDEALALPPDAREHFVQQLTDDTLRTEVTRLLAAHDTSGPLDRLLAEMHPERDTQPEPVRVGVWRIESLIARGGMGSVYRAERADGQYAQRAALKLLRRDVADPDLRRRFMSERRILARIDHPGIARILDGGVTPEGRPWFALEYVEGLPIDAWCEQHALGVRERLELFREVCAAVQHAHAHLVVHRDIKPANILVTQEGRAKLLDFGIARLLDRDAFPEDAGTTRTGGVLLTPAHASPEQLRGEAVNTASDVFQLGILLFELLTGRLPRRHHGPESTGETIGERPSHVATAALRAAIDDDLDTIVQAATRTEPARRYASVDRLSEDVQRWLDGRPISARPDTFRYRAGRFVRRNRAGVTLAAALVVSLMIGGFVAIMQGRRVEQERDRARQVIALLAGLLEPPVASATANPAVSAADATTPADFGTRVIAATTATGDTAMLQDIAGDVFEGSIVLRRAVLARAAARGARILWVDDNPSSNSSEIMLFRSLGADVHTVLSTTDAMRVLQTDRWDVVLSDMSRAGVGAAGIELLTWIRQQSSHTPVIFYVGVADPTRDRPMGSFGLTNRADELIHLVLDVLERRRL